MPKVKSLVVYVAEMVSPMQGWNSESGMFLGIFLVETILEDGVQAYRIVVAVCEEWI